ncbi:MAG: flagellar basal-body MS-ring/collar protein FliF [bacterium]
MSKANTEFMNNADALPKAEKPTLGETLAKAFVPQISSLVSLAAALTLGAGLILWASRPDYTPLYDETSQADAARITEVLRGQKIPYKLEPGTGLVTVPYDKLDEARMKLAAEGLPQNTNVGIEVLQQEQGLSTSRFIENARYQHALETELSRTISAMRNIETARVHLAMPKQSVFVRKRAKASASVLVKMNPGRSLSDEQVTSIVNLVASSIPYLQPDEVTIVDQWGRLLSSGQGKSGGLNERNRQFEFTRDLENMYSRRIEELLAPIVGVGKIRARVNADLDFSVQESTKEEFEPGEDQIRSEQSSEQTSSSPAGAVGVPGALTNQPPGAGTTDPESAKGGGEAGSSSKQATRNYELDKTITHTKAATGKIERLTVAVLVDNGTTVNDAGETVAAPRTEEEITRFTELVKQSIGFNEARGDSVVIINQAFKPVEEIAPLEEASLMEQPWVWSLGKQLIAGLGVLLLIFWLVRPAMRNLKSAQKAALAPPEPPAALKAEEELTAEVEEGEKEDKVTLSSDSKDGAPQLPSPPEVYGDILNMARVLASEDPKRVAKVLKNWVGESSDA